jgi:hypothetical protein
MDMNRTNKQATLGESTRANEDFWTSFVENEWERKPAVLKSPFSTDFVAEGQFLSWLRTAFDGTQDALGKEFFLSGIQQATPSGALLPLDSESTIHEFTERLSTTVGIKDYQYVLYGIGRFDASTTLRTRQALRPLLQRLGLPAGAVDTDCFFGDYKETAAGLHKDNAGVFSYVVHGTKTMLVWPFEYFADKTDIADAIRRKVRLSHVDFRPHVANATVLTAEPGDVLYWPSTYWHVSVGDGSPQMTFNISLYFPYQPRADVDEIIRLIAGPKLEQVWEEFYATQGKSVEELVRSVPESWRQVVDIYKQALNSNKFEGMLLGSWMRRLSSGGFTTRPAYNPNYEVADDDLLRGDPDFPVLTAPAAGDKRIVAASGSIFTAADERWLEVLVACANEGKPFSLNDVAARCGDISDANKRFVMDELRNIAERLTQCWGLHKVS